MMKWEGLLLYKTGKDKAFFILIPAAQVYVIQILAEGVFQHFLYLYKR